MSGPNCEIEGASVVLIGHFNPALVHPAWLARHKLVRDSEANVADVGLVRPEISVFSVGPFRVEAQPERFTISVEDMGNLGPLRDLVSGVFSILGHTPITRFGLNRHMHFKMDSPDAWHRVGHSLAPKAPWNGLIEEPGTRSVTIWGKWPTTRALQIQVTVEPSQRIQHGVYVGVIADFNFSSDDASDVLRTMHADWDECFSKARQLAESIVSIGREESSP